MSLKTQKTIFVAATLFFFTAVTAKAGVIDTLGSWFRGDSPILGATVSQSIHGGTGTSSTPVDNSIFIGHPTDKTYNVKTLTAGANITFSETGNTFTITGAAGGSAGPPNLIYRTLSTTKYYTASTSATDNLAWHFNNGFVSSASSTVAGTLRVTDSATLLGGATITCTGCVTDTNVADIALGGGTSGNYLRTLADDGQSTITVTGSGAEDADVTLRVVDVVCTACLTTTEISDSLDQNDITDIYLFNNADDSTSGRLTAAGLTSSAAINASSTYHGSGSLSLDLTTAPQLFFLDDNTYTRWGVRNAGGNLYFATTTVASNATSSPFAMQLTGTGGTGLFVGTTTNAHATGLAVEGTASLGSLTQATGGTNNDLCISAANVVVEETTGVCVVSSRKFKHNIKDLTVSGIDTIMGLRPVSFSPNDNVSFDFQDTQYGFIAEEVAETDAHLAKYGIDGEPRTLDDWAILSTTVKAIQDVWHKVTNIETRVERLEKENAELRDRIEVLEAKQ